VLLLLIKVFYHTFIPFTKLVPLHFTQHTAPWFTYCTPPVWHCHVDLRSITCDGAHV